MQQIFETKFLHKNNNNSGEINNNKKYILCYKSKKLKKIQKINLNKK